MQKPEYWEDDEKWAEYEAWRKANPEPEPETPNGLDRFAAAIAKARGNPADDIHGSIRFLNEMSRQIRGRKESV